jgi:Mycothiol maleylpyruvate isomerase N-terminal domain
MRSEPVLEPHEVGTYLDAVDWLIEVLGCPALAQVWGQPSAVARYSIGGMAAHAVHGGVVRLIQVLQEPEPDGHPVALVDFCGPNRMAQPDDDDPLFAVLRAGAEAVALEGQPALLDSCRSARSTLAVQLPTIPAKRAVSVVRIAGGVVSLRDYLRTRVLEVVVHGDDLVASANECDAPDPPAAAVEVSLELCLELARARLGDRTALRAFTRAERADPDALRIL